MSAGRSSGTGARLGVAIALLLAASGPAPADGAPRPDGASTRPASAPRAARVDLSELRRAELEADVDALWNEAPRLTLRVLLLRAGREVPATVTAARRTDRLQERERSLAWLRERLDSDPAAAAAWAEEVEARLEDSAHAPLWIATVRTLGRLGDASRAPRIAAALDGADPQLAHAARLALHDLFLRWFVTAEEFRAFWPEAQGTCGDSVFMETARAKEREAREALVQLLRYEPRRARELVRGPDPRLRAAAAAALGRAEGAEAEAAVEALFALLETEPSGEAFQAGLEALLARLSGATPDAPEVRRLRSLLVSRLRAAELELQAPLADGLRRIAWSEQGLGEDGLFVGIDALAGQLRRLLERDRLTDRDTLNASLGALLGLSRRAGEAGLELAPRLAGLEPALLDRVEDAGEDPAVRSAAVQLLPLLANGATIERLARSLAAPGLPASLGYSLLGALATLAAGLPPDDPATRRALETLLDQLDAPDEVLRQRSLAELRSPRLASLVALADPGAFVDALAVETQPDLQAQLLGLVSSHGGAPEAERLVGLERFDAVARSGPGAPGRLAQTLARLAGEDAALLVRCFQRLLDVDDAGTRVLRLREALGAVARLSPESLAALDDAAHRAVVAWATELRAASGSVPGGRDFLERLVEVHLPGCGGAAVVGEAARLEHVRALLLSDLSGLEGAAVEASAVTTAFAEAERLAGEAGDGRLRALVLRDRARFHVARGETGAALEDYRALFAAQLPPGAGGPGVLELADLRGGGALLVEAATAEGAEPTVAAARLAEALQVSLALVRDASWGLEPAAVRLKDLRDLTARAAGCGELVVVEEAAQLLTGLPELLPGDGAEPTPPPAAPEGAVWAGLLGEPVTHAELLALRDALAARAAALRPAPEEPAATEPSEPGPERAPEEEAPEAPELDPEEGREGGGPAESGDEEAPPAPRESGPQDGPPAVDPTVGPTGGEGDGPVEGPGDGTSGDPGVGEDAPKESPGRSE